jgi:hypothetical protein
MTAWQTAPLMLAGKFDPPQRQTAPPLSRARRQAGGGGLSVRNREFAAELARDTTEQGDASQVVW